MSQESVHELIEVGEHVVVPWTLRGAGRDGIEVEARSTWLCTIRDGLIVRICLCQEREEALEAAGLPDFGRGSSKDACAWSSRTAPASSSCG